MSDKKNPMELKLQLDEQTVDGKYVNFLSVFHNQAEFVMDFGRIVPGKAEVKILSRLISNPITLKQIARTLNENLERYEAAFGTIPSAPPPPQPPHKGFVQ